MCHMPKKVNCIERVHILQQIAIKKIVHMITIYGLFKLTCFIEIYAGDNISKFHFFNIS